MTASVPAVGLADLTLDGELGRGGQGVVHRVRAVRGRAAGQGQVVYKEYLPAVLPLLDTAALQSMVDLPGLGAEDTDWLRRRTAWPEALVTDRGQVTGFLMRQVPAEFEFDFQGLSAAGSGRRLANFEFLLNRDQYVAGIGLRISPRDRLMLLEDLARTLERLHRLGIAVGDLSPKNVLFSNRNKPSCLLIDCDAMRFRGRSALPQVETPDWQAPAGEEKATAHSDALKLGLLAIRLVARDQGSTDPGVLAPVDGELAALARRSLQPEPTGRPGPADWIPALARAAPQAS
ncbi:lipopolysaccharide kinase InaA family protein, partial [Kitasatospora sp. NPDC001574]